MQSPARPWLRPPRLRHAGILDSGAVWALDGGAALFLLCVTVAQVLGDRRVASAARAVAGATLVAIAAVTSSADGAPVLAAALSAAVLTGLVVVEIRSSLADAA